MKPYVLCLERLERILSVIDKSGGRISTRDLQRTYSIHESELNLAEEAGFIRFGVQKPKVGRPSRYAEKVSKTPAAKLPPKRSQIGRRISFRRWNFAFYYCIGELEGGMFGFRRVAYLAYQRAYPTSKSKAGARASASRLLKCPEVYAAIQWTFASHSEEIPKWLPQPKTEQEAWDQLREWDCWRIKRAPWWVKMKWQ